MHWQVYMQNMHVYILNILHWWWLICTPHFDDRNVSVFQVQRFLSRLQLRVRTGDRPFGSVFATRLRHPYTNILNGTLKHKCINVPFQDYNSHWNNVGRPQLKKELYSAQSGLTFDPHAQVKILDRESRRVVVKATAQVPSELLAGGSVVVLWAACGVQAAGKASAASPRVPFWHARRRLGWSVSGARPGKHSWRRGRP